MLIDKTVRRALGNYEFLNIREKINLRKKHADYQ